MRLDQTPVDEGPNERESAITTECGKAMHQMPANAELAPESRGEAPGYGAAVKPDEQEWTGTLRRPAW